MTIITYTVEPYSDIAGFRIIPVARISISYNIGKSGIYLSSFKYPVAIVLISESFQKVFRVTGEEITLQLLMTDFPELNKYMDRYLNFKG
jgi:hypothetical protein